MPSGDPQDVSRQPSAAPEGDGGGAKGTLKRNRTSMDHCEDELADKATNGNSKGLRKRTKRKDTKASREKQQHTRKQAAEARSRRAERTKNRHAKQKGAKIFTGPGGGPVETDKVEDEGSTEVAVPNPAEDTKVPSEPKSGTKRKKGTSRGRRVADDHYEIDSIVDMRITIVRKEEYLIRWKGCSESENSWVPSEDLCDSALVDAQRLKQEKLEHESKLRESKKLLGLGESIETTRNKIEDERPTEVVMSNSAGDTKTASEPQSVASVPSIETNKIKDEGSTEADIANPSEGPKVVCEPDPSTITDEDLHWMWSDEQQVVFREVARINVNDSDAGDRVTEAREDGKPVVLVGHKGWANFAKRWLEMQDSTEMEAQSTETKSSNETNSSLLDLSQPHALNISRMIEDIGQEKVPVVKLKYNEEKPISATVEAKTFLEEYRNDFSLGDASSETSPKESKLYLHQWQFPLSDSAGLKLCRQNQALPNGILGEDLLKYWYGDDFPQCKADSPLQYLFMGAKGTMSKLHRDNGGLAISIAPIVGEKECVLVHRSDGGDCLYQLDAKLDRIDLQSFPLMTQARVWKTTVRPGEILLMPHGTYHQCRNLTPCLSYSRFHLDTVNIRAFLQSMYDGDATELDHENVIYNAAYELVEKIDAYVEKVQKHVECPGKYEDSPLTTGMIDTADAVRCLRHICREISRRKAKQADVKRLGLPVHVSTKPDESLRANLDDKEGERSKYTADEWSTMVMDIDMCLHEFRYCRKKKKPRFRPRQAVDTSINTAIVKEGKLPVASNRGSRMEKAFLKLRRVADEEEVKVSENDFVTIHLLGRIIKGTILQVEPEMTVAKLSFEEYPAIFDEYHSFDRLRETKSGSEVKADKVKPGLRVICKTGGLGEDYRAVVESIHVEPMYKVRLEFGSNFKIDRWLPRTSIVKVDHTAVVSSDSPVDQMKQDAVAGNGEDMDGALEGGAGASENVSKGNDSSIDTASDELKLDTDASDDKEASAPFSQLKPDLEETGNGEVTGDPSTVMTMAENPGTATTEMAADELCIAMMDDSGTTTRMAADESGDATMTSSSEFEVPEVRESATPRRSRVIFGVPTSSDSSSSPDQEDEQESVEGEL